MTEQERNSQSKKAKAKYELVKMLAGRGQASEAELLSAKDQMERWSEEVLKPLEVVVKVKERGQYIPESTFQKSLPDNVKEIIDKLEAERTAVDAQKKGLSTALAEIEERVIAREIVEDILFMRGKWQDLTDRIKYVYQFHKLPEAPVESIFDEHDFALILPNSKFELDKEIRNLGANLSKYRTRLQQSKTEVRKQHYQTLIAQAELKFGVMKAKFNHL